MVTRPMDMVERVARAIFLERPDLEQWHWPGDAPRKWKSPGGALYDSHTLPHCTATGIRAQARAAIEATQYPQTTPPSATDRSEVMANDPKIRKHGRESPSKLGGVRDTGRNQADRKSVERSGSKKQRGA